MTLYAHGDVVNVVMDCCIEQRGDRQVAVIYVRLVDRPAADGGAPAPAVFPAASRATWQTFLGLPNDQQSMGAFAIDVGPAT